MELTFWQFIGLFLSGGIILVVYIFQKRIDREMEDVISDVPAEYGRIPMTDEQIERLQAHMNARGIFPQYRTRKEA